MNINSNIERNRINFERRVIVNNQIETHKGFDNNRKKLEIQEKLACSIAKAGGVEDKFDDIICEASKKYNVDPNLIKAIIKKESNFNPRSVSKVGAKGLMQLTSNTAKAVGVKNSFDPKQNIMGGTKYLRQLINQFGDLGLALAAYNAGPGNVRKHKGIPPFKETQNYVKKVLEFYENYKKISNQNQ